MNADQDHLRLRNFRWRLIEKEAMISRIANRILRIATGSTSKFLYLLPAPIYSGFDSPEFKVRVRAMRTFYRSLLTLAILLLAYGVLIEAFDRMNLPNDRSFFAGTAMILGMLVVVPAVIHFIWRRER